MSIWDNFTIGTGPAKDSNNLNQPINNISELQNTNNYSQTDILKAITDANKINWGAGIFDITDFMGNLAAKESALGETAMGDYSFSPFQIDPIKYRDIVERAEGGDAKMRAGVANDYLRGEFNDPDFDILNLFEGVSTEKGEEYVPNAMLQSHNPLVGAVLTRLGLANIPEQIPDDLTGQADYWKKHWNPGGAGTEQQFIDASKYHFPNRVNPSITNPLYQQALTP